MNFCTNNKYLIEGSSSWSDKVSYSWQGRHRKLHDASRGSGSREYEHAQLAKNRKSG